MGQVALQLPLEVAIHKSGLSARACSRVLKVARTIADLAGAKDIQLAYFSEAIQRSLDRRMERLSCTDKPFPGSADRRMRLTA